jgi:transcriptional regulator with XRE-family HTH domain
MVRKGSSVVNKSSNPTDQHVGKRMRMRRLMLDVSQTDLANGLGVTFQQVQKYENRKNRVSASRLRHIAQIPQVPIPFFFEGAPTVKGQPNGLNGAASPSYVSDFLATSDGLALVEAFVRIKDPRLKRAIVTLVKQIAAAGAL